MVVMDMIHMPAEGTIELTHRVDDGSYKYDWQFTARYDKQNDNRKGSCKHYMMISDVMVDNDNKVLTC